MDKEDFNYLLNSMEVYDKNKYNYTLFKLKHNICQNIRIARKLANMELDHAAQLLDLQPQSLRRIEAKNDRDEFSSKVLIMAIMVYGQDANFYFEDWKKNEMLLQKEKLKV